LRCDWLVHDRWFPLSPVEAPCLAAEATTYRSEHPIPRWQISKLHAKLHGIIGACGNSNNRQVPPHPGRERGTFSISARVATRNDTSHEEFRLSRLLSSCRPPRLRCLRVLLGKFGCCWHGRYDPRKWNRPHLPLSPRATGCPSPFTLHSWLT
jgi:hypothetical protein